MPKLGFTSEASGDMPLHTAIDRGDFTKFCVLVRLGAGVNEKNRNGDTPLHLLLQNKAGVSIDDYSTLIRFLLEHGAAVDQKNKYGETALYLAAKQQHIVAVELLLQHGAAVDQKNQFGQTALHLVVEGGDTAATELLLQHGAAVDQKDQFGQTALHLAVGEGHTAVVKLLLQHGAAVDQKNAYGETALHRAMRFRGFSVSAADCFDAVLCLLDGGADVAVSDANGETVLETAIRCSGRSKLSELFIHEHLSRSSDQKHEQSSATVIEFRDEESKGTPVVLRLAVRDLLDRSKPNEFMSKLVSRGVGAKPARNKLEEIIASDRIKDGCSYCLSGLRELLAEQEERVLETDGALKRFNAYAYPPREDEPLTRIPEEVAEQILSRLPVGRLRLFTEALSPSNTSRVYDATELCNPDTGVPSLKP